MEIKNYTEKVKVEGSRFEEYAIMSKLSGTYLIKHLRFIDPIIDDDGVIFPFVRKDHIIFISGLAISVVSLADFLEEVNGDSYTDYAKSVYFKREGNDPLKTLIVALEKIDVITINRQHTSNVCISPKEAKPGSPWDLFFDLMYDVGYDSNSVDFEDEITDF